MSASSLILRDWQNRALQDGRLGLVLVPIGLRGFRPADMFEVGLCDKDWRFRDRRGMGQVVTTQQLMDHWCPYTPGSTLAVREGWRFFDWTEDGDPFIQYKSGGDPILFAGCEKELSDIWAELSRPANFAAHGGAARDVNWRSPATMPIKLARSHITVGNVRPVRVRELGEDEARLCGHEHVPPRKGWSVFTESGGCYSLGSGCRPPVRGVDGVRDFVETVYGGTPAKDAMLRYWTQDHGRKHPWGTAWAWAIEVADVQTKGGENA